MDQGNVGKVTVGIVESDENSRWFITAIVGGTPGLATSWSCLTGKAALDSIAQIPPPNVVVVSLHLRDMTGIDFMMQARAIRSGIAYVLLLPRAQAYPFVEALEAGAGAYLTKPCATETLVRTIRTVHQGGAVVSNEVAKTIVDYFRARGSVIDKLTNREQHVLTCLACGFSQARIAGHLDITTATVHAHVRSVLGKLDVHSTSEAIALYLNPRIPSPRQTDLPWPAPGAAASLRMTRPVPSRVLEVLESEAGSIWDLDLSSSPRKKISANSRHVGAMA